MGLAHLMLVLVFAVVGGVIALVLRGPRARTAPAAKRGLSRAGAVLIAMAGLTLALVLGAIALMGRPRDPYFPEGAFHAEPERNESTVEWYSEHLAAMREPSLWTLAQGKAEVTTYRLLWLPSFDHPACVRITHSGGKTTLRAVALTGLGGYEPGEIAIDRTVRLGEHDWAEVEGLFRALSFWDLPTKPSPEDFGTDGDQLILEAAMPGRYHIVDRWAPDARYLKACRRLAELSGIGMLTKLDRYHDPAPP